MHLLQAGDFTLNSGAKSTFRLECDALTEDDWDGAAEMAFRLVGPFSRAHGVPRGGVPFADAMNRLAVRTHFPMSFVPYPTLVVDDVLTTGGSIQRFLDQLGKTGKLTGSCGVSRGLVLFARGPCPPWVRAVFQLPEELWVKNG